jgi:hypothetical protein
MLAPIPKLFHSADIPDMTLRMLDTECIEPTSELRLRALCEFPRKET